MSEKKIYTVVGGCPFREYTGTTTFTALRVLGVRLTAHAANQLLRDNYESCGGLLFAFDEDGKELT